MTFQLFSEIGERGEGAIDTETGARLEIVSTKEIDQKIIQFTTPDSGLNVTVFIEGMDKAKPYVQGDTSNPYLKINCGDLQLAFEARKRAGLPGDVEYNSRQVDLLVRMLCFANKAYPICRTPVFWSDYQETEQQTKNHRNPRDMLFHIRSNDELRALSLNPTNH